MKIDHVTAISLFIVGFLIGGALIIGGLTLSHKPKPSLGIVDAHTLVTVEAQKVAKEYPKGVVPPEKIHSIAARLKKMVDHFASENQVIIFAKGAVWGGELPDYTDYFLEKLTEKWNPDVH